jgi:hypothetical protein
MKFRENRLDITSRVVIAIVSIAALVVIGMIIARLTRGSSLV